MGFPCTGCGGCCRLISEILKDPEAQPHPVLQFAVRTFPYKPDASGACEKLVDNLCSVYSERPLLCDVHKLGLAMGVSQEKWFGLNAVACNAIIDSLGIDPVYKITDL